MKSHHEEDNSSLKCEQCASTFGTKLELDTHEWTVHISNFRCDSCTYVTDKSTEYTEHIKGSHTPVLHAFKCNSCNQETSTAEEINEHMKTQEQLQSLMPNWVESE